MTAPSLGELLQQARRKILAVGSGTSGAAFLLNHTVATGPIIHHEFTLPSSLAPHVLEILGPPPPARAAERRTEPPRGGRLPQARARRASSRRDADVDQRSRHDRAHSRGVGVAVTREALTRVDAEIGRIEDTLQAEGLLARTNVIVTADHGFSTHTATLKLDALVEPFAHARPDGSRDIVVSEGAIYLRPGAADPVAPRLAAIVAALQRRPRSARSSRGRRARRSGAVVPGTYLMTSCAGITPVGRHSGVRQLVARRGMTRAS